MGPDLLSGLVLKECASELATPLYIIYNRSLKSGVFPTLFKVANVTPIFKSGDKSKVNNYRPISLLPIISKVFEKLCYSRLFSHVRGHISDCQHGFMKGRSTLTNLACYVDYVTYAIDNKLQVEFSHSLVTLNRYF